MTDEKEDLEVSKDLAAALRHHAVFEGTGELGEPVQIILANVITTLDCGVYLQVVLSGGFGIRMAPHDTERFRDALRAWWGVSE